MNIDVVFCGLLVLGNAYLRTKIKACFLMCEIFYFPQDYFTLNAFT